MAQTTLELTIMGAEGLKNVSFLRGKMDPFVVAFVDPFSKRSTRILKKGGSNPIWNDFIAIPVEDRFLFQPNSSLTIQVFNQSPIGTSLIGATQVMLHDLLRRQQLKGNEGGDVLTFQLYRPSGRPHGMLRAFFKAAGGNLAAGGGMFDGEGKSFSELPATGYPADGYPAMTMPYYGAPMMQHPSYTSNKYAYPYPGPDKKQGYLPYPMEPARGPRRDNKNFVYGILSGAVAAILLGAIF